MAGSRSRSRDAAGPSRPSAFSQYRALLGKDLRHEFRTGEMLSSMGIYAVLVLIVFGVVFSQVGTALDVKGLAGGLVWVLIVFTSLLGLGRSFSYEKEASALEGILLVPLDRSAVYLAKLTSNLLFLLVVELVALPLFYFFFLTGADPAPTFWYSLAPIVLGTFGVSAVGTLLASITASARAHDVLLAVLFIPLAFPLLYACVAATTACLTADPAFAQTMRVSIALIVAYDVVMALVSWVLYDYVIGG